MSDKLNLGHAAGVSSTCGRCGGLIMDAGTHYGYAGKVCQCNWQFHLQQNTFPPQNDRELLIEIRDLLKKLTEQSR